MMKKKEYESLILKIHLSTIFLWTCIIILVTFIIAMITRLQTEGTFCP